MLQVPGIQLQPPDQGIHVAFIALAMVVTANNRNAQEPTGKVGGSTFLREAKKEQWKTSPVSDFHVVRMQSASSASCFSFLEGLMYMD